MIRPADAADPGAARLLVVDDEASNRMLLRDVLEADGYQVNEADDGLSALAAIATSTPDVVLLDVMMPGLDGIETCRRLKADEQTAPIPVILVTAQRSREDRLAGIAAGATDFLSKPVDMADLRLRVRNALRTKHLYDQVQEKLKRVEELEELRDDLVHMIVHDLRSPLTAMRASLELIQLEGEGLLDGELLACVRHAADSADTITRLVTSMLDVSKFEAGEMPLVREVVDLHGLVTEAVRSLGRGSDRVRIEDGFPGAVAPTCDPEIICRVLVNLLTNAIDYSPPEAGIAVHVLQRNGSARVEVRDHGPGIPEEYQEKIFDKFGQVAGRTKIRKASTGLGLAFCKLAVEAHHGSIGVESREGSGSIFWFELPLIQ